MSEADLLFAVASIVAVAGVTAHLLSRDLVRRIVALNVASGGVMMMLLGVAARRGVAEPDPVPQALVLTGIVIMAAVTGLALGLARQVEAFESQVHSGEAAGPGADDTSAGALPEPDRADAADPDAGDAQTDEQGPGP